MIWDFLQVFVVIIKLSVFSVQNLITIIDNELECLKKF